MRQVLRTERNIVSLNAVDNTIGHHTILLLYCVSTSCHSNSSPSVGKKKASVSGTPRVQHLANNTHPVSTLDMLARSSKAAWMQRESDSSSRSWRSNPTQGRHRSFITALRGNEKTENSDVQLAALNRRKKRLRSTAWGPY